MEKVIHIYFKQRPAMAILGLKSAKTLLTYEHLKEEKLKTEALKLGNVM